MNNIKELPIGIFDSGVGGLTVVKELQAQLPGEAFIYLGDTARYPYGPRSPEIIKQFALECSSYLLKQPLKVLIIACNTASANAVGLLRKNFTLPIIEVITPGAQLAAESTRIGKVGIIGTTATIQSSAYIKALLKFDPRLKTFSQACPLFVALAEEGWISGEVPKLITQHYLKDLIRAQIDTLIMGCTHYPLLKAVIGETMGKEVQLIDSAYATVNVLKKYLKENGLLSDRIGPLPNKYYVTDAPDRFARVGSHFLNKELNDVQKIFIDKQS
ncbi:glutamate racemase [bacterium]|nr:glutamate racemase [bacterium]